jgi:hypothetical protein
MHGCCNGKKWLKILAGLVLILVSASILTFNPWLVVGLYLLLAGACPMLCTCENCAECRTEGKKKK